MEHWEEKAEKLTGKIARMKNLKITFNPFSTNVPFMDKPASWFLLGKCLKKHLWKSHILSKDAGHRPASLLKMTLFHRCFSNILLVKTNYLASTSVEHWSKMG